MNNNYKSIILLELIEFASNHNCEVVEYNYDDKQSYARLIDSNDKSIWISYHIDNKWTMLDKF